MSKCKNCGREINAPVDYCRSKCMEEDYKNN